MYFLLILSTLLPHYPLYFLEQRHEQIGVIVGAFLLYDGNKTFQTHTTVYVFLGQRSKFSIKLTKINRQWENTIKSIAMKVFPI